MSGRKILKWVGIAIGSLVGLLVLVAVLVPLFVNVDKYRPEIVTAAEEHLNGELQLGKLSLSLWGSLRVNVDGFSLTDAGQHKVVAAKDVFFEMPLWSLVTGAPRLTFNLNHPELYVHREPSGDLNVMNLVKKKEAGEAAPAESPEGKTGELPGIVAAARLGLAMRDANLVYEDKKAGLNTTVQDLNVIARNLSLSSPSEIEMWADLNTVMDKSLSVKGPVRLNASATPQTDGGQFKEALVSFKLDGNDLVIEVPGTFEKPKGVEAWVSGKLTVGPESAACRDLEMRFHNASLKGQAEVTGLKTPPMQIEVRAETPSVELAPWKKLVVALRPYEISGTVGLKASASGPLDKLQYQADFSAKSVSFSGAGLLAKPVVDATVQIRPERIEKFQLAMKAPGNDLRLNGSLTSFTAPKLSLSILSKGMDLDQLIKFEKKEGAPQASKGKPASEGVDFDGMLEPVRKNAILRKATGVVTANLSSVKMMNVTIKDIQSRMTVKNLVFSLEKFGLGVFAGKVAAKGAVNVQAKAPSYALELDISGVDLKQAVESQFAPFKNTLVGKGFFKMGVKGSSFNPPAAKANLNGQGNMRIQGAKFNTIDIGRVATEAINKAISDVASKVPELRGQKLDTPKAVESDYESVTSNFRIEKGLFSAPDFFAKAVPNRGIDIRGNTRVNMTTDALEAEWALRDTYNLLRARDMSVKIAGTVVPQILAEGGVVSLPVQVRGTVNDPKVSYTSVPEALAKVALENVKRAAEQRVKSEVQKAVQKEAGKLLNQGLKGLFK